MRVTVRRSSRSRRSFGFQMIELTGESGLPAHALGGCEQTNSANNAPMAATKVVSTARCSATGREFQPAPRTMRQCIAAQSVPGGMYATAHQRGHVVAEGGAMLKAAGSCVECLIGEDQPFPHALGGTNAATASSALRCLIASVRLMRFCKRRYPVHPHTHEKPWSIARSPLSLQ